jgi:hypothetical protein
MTGIGTISSTFVATMAKLSFDQGETSVDLDQTRERRSALARVAKFDWREWSDDRCRGPAGGRH